MADENDDGRPAEATDPVKVMEGFLRRAQLLQGSINAFERDLAVARPLPPVQAVQSRLNAIQSALHDFIAEVNQPRNRDLLSRTAVLPNAKFPRIQSHMLETLLRTKMEPSVEDWETQTLKAAAEREDKEAREKINGRMTTLLDTDREDIWQWAARAAQQEAMKHAWFQADYTMAEKEAGIETVVHGLKRRLIVPETPGLEDDDYDDDEDEDEFEDIGVEVEEKGKDDAHRPDGMDIDIARPQTQLANADGPVVAEERATRAVDIDKIHRYMTKGVPL